MMVCLTYGDPLITIKKIVDYKELSNLTRITKLQKIKFSFGLTGNDRWA